MASFMSNKHSSALIDDYQLPASMFRMTNMPVPNDPMIIPSNEQEEKSTKLKYRIIETLIDVIQEQANQSQCNVNNLSKVGWSFAFTKFRAISGLNYDDSEILNMWDDLKSKWSMWYQRCGKNFVLAWNNEMNYVEWWDKKTLGYPRAIQFRYRFLIALKLTSLFAPDEYAWVASSGVLPDSLKKGYDYHNVKNPKNQDTLEGAGDSEDPDFGANIGDKVCASFGLGNFTFNNSKGTILSEAKTGEVANSPTSSARVSRVDDDNRGRVKT